MWTYWEARIYHIYTSTYFCHPEPFYIKEELRVQLWLFAHFSKRWTFCSSCRSWMSYVVAVFVLLPYMKAFLLSVVVKARLTPDHINLIAVPFKQRDNLTLFEQWHHPGDPTHLFTFSGVAHEMTRVTEADCSHQLVTTGVNCINVIHSLLLKVATYVLEDVIEVAAECSTRLVCI